MSNTWKRHITRKEQWHSGLKRIAPALFLVLTAFTGWQIGAAFRLNRVAEAHQGERDAKLAMALSERILHTAKRQPAGPVFPYSVVPGGLGSVEDMKAEMAEDRVVAAHYARFDLNKAHMIRADKERHVYVSYRIGDRIYWTSKKLTIKAGEALVTDGDNTARGRCGNLLSDTPQKPVFTGEPTAKTFDTPDQQPPEITMAENRIGPGPDFGSGSPVVPATPAFGTTDATSQTKGGAFVPPVYYPFGGSNGGNSTPPTPPPTPVPEPGTGLMLLSGLGAAGWLVWRGRKSAAEASRAARQAS